MKEGFISVAEFARRAGVSRQTVYNALKSNLKDFCQVDEEGKKVLDERALKDFAPSQRKSNFTSVDSKGGVKFTDELTAILQGEITHLRQENEFLRAQVTDKDKQLVEQMETLARLAEQAQRLTEQAHTLHAADKPQFLPQEQEETQTEGKREGQKKKGFFRRIFGK